jgi:hypothetical protein
MSKWVYVFAAAGLASLMLLVLISIPIPRQTSTIPFSLEDGTTGAVKLIIPENLRQRDWTEIELDVKFETVETTDQNVKIKTILQTASMEVKPAGEVTAIIPVEGIAPFRWLIRSTGLEDQRATLWCFRQDASGLTMILARDIEFEVRSFLSMTFQLTRWILGTTTVLCLMVFVNGLTTWKRQTGRK